MVKILVTGGAGFVGSHLSEKLMSQGHVVTILDNMSTGYMDFITNARKHGVTFWMNDILNSELNLSTYDVVFHLAAKPFSKAVHDWFSESDSIFETNARGTFNILRHIEPECHFILVSSASVYGEGRGLVEDDEFNPLSAYGYSKTIAEQIAMSSPRRCTIVRPGTIIGARGRCFPNRVIWSLLHDVQCTFFKNGDVLRDVIDVEDVVSALIKIMEEKLLGTYNLGSNIEVTGHQLAVHAKRFAKKRALIFKSTFSSLAPSDFVTESTLNSNKLYESLTWQPKRTLSESLNLILQYYSTHVKAVEPPSWDSL